jgi:NADH:ubiquinone oxidoreductase subunit
MAHIGTRIATWIKGKPMGADRFGNRYYEERGCVKNRRRKRWVLYKGIVEASKVPAEWHGWLHYTLDAPQAEIQRYSWQKDHLPNLTGTLGRYLPKGHVMRGAKRAASSADYQPWQPK